MKQLLYIGFLSLSMGCVNTSIPESSSQIGKSVQKMKRSGLNIQPHINIKLDLKKKNGLIAEASQGEINGYQYYVNGLKHGPYYNKHGIAFNQIDSVTFPSDGFYNRGKKHGQFNQYNKWNFVDEIICFEMGDTLWKSQYGRRWKAFPYRFLVTPYRQDQTIHVKDPSGSHFYSGHFHHKKPVGKHTVYRSDESIIAKINYDNWTFSHFIKDGNPRDTILLTSSWSVYLGR